MAANTNPTTGIPYGYISAHCLDNDLVNGLLYGEGVADFHNLSWESACEDYIVEAPIGYGRDDVAISPAARGKLKQGKGFIQGGGLLVGAPKKRRIEAGAEKRLELRQCDLLITHPSPSFGCTLFSGPIHSPLVGGRIEHFLAALFAIPVFHGLHYLPAFAFVIFSDWHSISSKCNIAPHTCTSP